MSLTGRADAANVQAFETGTSLNRLCQSLLLVNRQGMKGNGQLFYQTGVCQGYVGGVIDSLLADRRTSETCIPDGLDETTAAEIIAKYLDQNPAQRMGAAYLIVRGVLTASFPCPHAN